MCGGWSAQFKKVCFKWHRKFVENSQWQGNVGGGKIESWDTEKMYEKVQGEEAAWEILQQYDRRKESENMGMVKEKWPEERNRRFGHGCIRTGIEKVVHQETDR